MAKKKAKRKPVLRRCPFCGCKAELVSIFDEAYVRCISDKCVAEGPLRTKAYEAISAWNKRPK